MTSKSAHAYRADAATRGLWHLDVGRGGFTVPDAAFETDPDTMLLYHLEESGPPVMDSSDSHNDGTLSGDPATLAEGRFDNGIEFDGIDDAIRAPDATSLEPGAEDFTVEAFVKLDAEAALPATVVARWDEELEMRAYRLFIDIDGHLAAEVSADGTAATVTGLAGTTPVTAAEWRHVVLQRKGDVLSLWLNGEKEAEAGFVGAVFDGGAEFIVGAIIDMNGNPADVFMGAIDEVRVSAVARYPDEETPDSSGNENHGGLWRGAAITPADEGRFDRALSLDGVDDYVEVPDDATLELGSSDFTIEAWVKPSDIAGLRVILSKWSDADLSYRLSLDGGIPRLDLSSDGVTVYTLNATAAVPATVETDKWTHVAATRDGTVVKLIVDDAVVATGTLAGALHDGPAPVRVGACAVDGAEGFFAGLVDEVRISDTDREGALGTVEVGYTYNARNQLVTETSGTSVKTYSYDMNGNTVMIAETVNGIPVAVEAMAYDELNRMLSHTGPRGSESFAYRGAEWHRFSANGTNSIYDGNNVLLDVGGPGGGTFYVTPFLDQNLSMTRGGATDYYSQDGLGSVRTLTGSGGVVKNRYDYLAFGRPFTPGTSIATLSQRYTYAGREQNPLGPMMYCRYRQYDLRTGRYTARDPLGHRSGPNVYTYVGNRPVTVRDPMALITHAECGAAVARALQTAKAQDLQMGMVLIMSAELEIDPAKRKCRWGGAVCGCCDPRGLPAGFTGYFEPGEAKVVICEDRLQTVDAVEAMVLHELSHAHDQCWVERGPDDFTQCRQLACSEVRAYSLDGGCDEGGRRRQAGETRRRCVIRQAEHSMSIHEPCRPQETQYVESVMPYCYGDGTTTLNPWPELGPVPEDITWF